MERRVIIIDFDSDDLSGGFTSMDIYNNPELYSFLISYYLPELDDPYFYREIDQATDPRLFLSEQFAAWLPWEKHYPEIKTLFRAAINKQAG